MTDPDRTACRSTWLLSTLIGVAVVPTPARAQSPAATDSLLAGLDSRVTALKVNTDRLVHPARLLDDLHFGWFDRPYARATLGVLVKTSAVLEHEARLRRSGNGAIHPRDLAQMLQWADEAIERLNAAPSANAFRPDQFSPNGLIAPPSSSTPTLLAFLDESSATSRDPHNGDLDLFASLGGRVYAQSSRTPGVLRGAKETARRAAALGMARVFIETVLPSTSNSGDASLSEEDLRLVPRTLGDLLGPASGGLRENLTSESAAVLDPPDGESWPASQARRALARGMLGRARFPVVGWSARRTAHRESALRAARASLWVDALEGVSLAVAFGWRDLRDGSGSPYPSLSTDPARLELLASSGLELLQFADVVQTLRASPTLAVVLEPNAVDPGDPNRWAPWTLTLWQKLLDSQLHFDVFAAGAWDKNLRSPHELVLEVGAEDLSRVDDLILSVAREAARKISAPEPPAVRSSGVVRPCDGETGGGWWVRAAKQPDGRTALVVVNMRDQARQCFIEPAVCAAKADDLLSGSAVDLREPLDFFPHHVRVFRCAR